MLLLSIHPNLEIHSCSELFGTSLKAESNSQNQFTSVWSGSVTFAVQFRFELIPNQTVATLLV